MACLYERATLINTNGILEMQSKPTLEAQAAVSGDSKPSKKKNGGHIRRQNRSCDQCRKGKRRCDAAVVRDDGTRNEDWEFDATQRTPAACTYCVKTKKHCTFDWLRSQESHLKGKKDGVAESTIKQHKRIKTGVPSRQYSQNNQSSESDSSTSPDVFDSLHYMNGSATSHDTEPILEFPFVDPALQQHTTYTQCPFEYSGDMFVSGYPYTHMGYPPAAYDFSPSNALAPQVTSPQAGITWDQPNASDISYISPRSKRSLPTHDDHTNEYGNSAGNTFTIPAGLLDPSPLSLADRLSRSANHCIISEGLMKIYHDSMENALSCWLAERTCPYLSKTKTITSAPVPSTTDKYTRMSNDDNWPNRMFNRVYHLDRMAGKIRTRPLSRHEEKAASKALYLVIMAFATQWSQGSSRSREDFPLPSMGNPRDSRSCSNSSFSTNTDDYDFDRQLQEGYWYEARNALMLSAETESFKVAFANIIFAFIQRPLSAAQQSEIRQTAATSSMFASAAFDLDRVEEEVDRVMSEDSPPIYFEQGIRNAHLLRDRLLRLERELEGTGEKVLSDEDRVTVDLIAWLGYMGDTLTSTTLHRPLVVGDEECDVLPEAIEALKLSDTEPTPQTAGASRLWSDYMFMQERYNRGGQIPRYPCSYDDAAAGLTDAAPIKVLLYRKVQAIQNLITRHALASKIEEAIQHAKEVYHHWKVVYEPFIQDLIENHDSIHPRLQAWYICMTAHYYLAALLFAEAMHQVDSTCLGLSSHQSHRNSGNVIHSLRRHNSLMLASVAARATPYENSSFPKSDFHHAMNSATILTEPWTALLVRAFFKATILLLKDVSSLVGQEDIRSQLIRGAQECVRAIKYLGRKSDTAMLAGEMLDTAIDRIMFSTPAEFSIPFDESVLHNDKLPLFDESLCNESIDAQFDLLTSN